MAERPRGSGGLRHVSDILTDITQADEPEVSPSVRHAIQGDTYRPWCPCGDCMRAYLKSLDERGEPA